MPEPWPTWLSPIRIVLSESNVAAVIVPEEVKSFYENLEVLTKIYESVCKLWPETNGIVVVSGPIYDLVDEGTVILNDIKLLQ